MAGIEKQSKIKESKTMAPIFRKCFMGPMKKVGAFQGHTVEHFLLLLQTMFNVGYAINMLSFPPNLINRCQYV